MKGCYSLFTLQCLIGALQLSNGERRVRGLLQSFEDCKKKMATSSSSSSSYPSLLSCLMCLQEGNIKSERNVVTTTSDSTNTAHTNENKDAFDKIYKDSTWSMAGGGSGVGSDPAFAHGAGLVLQLGDHTSISFLRTHPFFSPLTDEHVSFSTPSGIQIRSHIVVRCTMWCSIKQLDETCRQQLAQQCNTLTPRLTTHITILLYLQHPPSLSIYFQCPLLS